MAADVFKLFGSIGLKTEDAEKGMKDVVGEAETTGNNLTSIFKKAAVAIGGVFAVGKLIDFSKTALEASATSQALNSQFSQVFGDLEDEARAGMERVAQEVGSLPNRLLPAFNQISSFAKVNGMETSEALGFTERAMVAAADSAAWYDKSIEETTDTLQSYLKGNYEVADNLGILSTETTRNAAATAMFGDEYKNLSGLQQQEVLLAMYEEANQLSGAMGQAAREADGWENVMGNLKQSWQDFLAIVGAPILKAVIPIVQGITNWVVKLAKAFKDGNPTLDAMKEIFVAIGEVLKDVFVETMEVLNELWAEFSELMGSIDWDGIYNSIKDVIDKGLKFFEPILTAINRVIQAQIDYWKGLFNAIKQIFNGDWQGAWETLKTTFVTAIVSIADALYDGFIGMFDNVKELLVGIDWLGVGQSIMSALGSAISAGIEILGDIGATIKTWISEKLGLGADGSWSEIGDKVWTNIKAGVDSAITGAENIADSIRTWIIDKLGMDEGSSWLDVGKKILSNIVEAVGEAGQKFGEFVSKLVGGINDAMTAEDFNAMVNNFLTFIATAIGGALMALGAIAWSLISGIGLGLTGADKWSEIGEKILGGIKSYLKGKIIDLKELLTFTGEPKFNEDGTGGNLSPSANPNTSDNVREGKSSGFGIGSAGGSGKGASIDMSAIDTLVTTVTEKINGAVASIEELGRNYTAKLIDGMIKGITTNQSKVILNVGILGNNMKSELDKIHEKANQAVTAGMNKIEFGYRSGLTRARATVRDNLAQITEAFRSQIASVTKAGEDTGRGFYNGLASQQSRIENLARSIARSVDNTIRATLEIASPSKVGERTIGFYTGTIVDGLLNAVSSVKNATGQVADAMLFDPQVAEFDYSTMGIGGGTGKNATNDLTLIRILSDTNEKLDQIIFKETDLFMNGRKMTEELDEPMNNYRRTQEILRSRQGGTWA